LDPRGYVLRAEAEVASLQMTAAQADLKRAIEVAPRNPVGYLAMGNFLRTEAHNREAREYYERALECDPGNVQSLSEIASILNLQKQNAQALERVQSQILMAPNSDEMYALLGRLQAAKKDMAAAKASLQKSVQLNPNNLNALVLLSKIEIAQGDVEEALATSYKSIKANPRNVVAYYFAGTMEEMRGKPQQAEKAYRDALQVDPHYAPAANNLAYLLLQSGENTDEALSLAQLARQEMPDSPSAADTLAWGYYQKGIYGGAANLLQEALQKAPDNATYHYHIGMVYEKQKDPVAARRHLQRALKISPNSPVAPEIRKALNQIG
jgi:cellulose synthase operon protein C